MKNNFYVYAYLRNKDSKTAKAGTPYYIGKGIDNRAFVKHHGSKPPPLECIIFLKENLSEQEALDLEIKLIAEYGRKDLNTGILNNKTNGGEGLKNPSLITRKKLSEAKRNESNETKLKRSIAAKNRIRHPLSEETKKKISKANSGRKREEKAKKKMSIAAKGKLKTKETKEKIKKKLKNRPKPISVCPTCGKSGGISAMIRWHFDNCKHLKGN
jgi:hypothetical protein